MAQVTIKGETLTVNGIQIPEYDSATIFVRKDETPYISIDIPVNELNIINENKEEN